MKESMKEPSQKKILKLQLNIFQKETFNKTKLVIAFKAPKTIGDKVTDHKCQSNLV